jgi:hypothetical protein
MKLQKHLELDQRTGALDVQVLDVLAQVESLLRGAREIQRQILRVRGVPRPGSAARRRAAAEAVQHVADKMLHDSRSLADVLEDLQRTSETLIRAAAETIARSSRRKSVN